MDRGLSMMAGLLVERRTLGEPADSSPSAEKGDAVLTVGSTSSSVTTELRFPGRAAAGRLLGNLSCHVRSAGNISACTPKPQGWPGSPSGRRQRWADSRGTSGDRVSAMAPASRLDLWPVSPLPSRNAADWPNSFSFDRGTRSSMPASLLDRTTCSKGLGAQRACGRCC